MHGEFNDKAISLSSTRVAWTFPDWSRLRRLQKNLLLDARRLVRTTQNSHVVGVVLAALVTAATADLCAEGNDTDDGEDGEDRDEDHGFSLGGVIVRQ